MPEPESEPETAKSQSTPSGQPSKDTLGRQPSQQTVQESEEELAYANRPFRGWRLLGVIVTVVVVLAIISAIVDWIVIGPLEGRVF